MTRERARGRELPNAGILAARQARDHLAQALAWIEAQPVDHDASRLTEEISLAIGKLYACELGEAEFVLHEIRAASGILSSVLARVHGPAGQSVVDRAAEAVARALAILYPVRAGLERALSEPRPVLLKAAEQFVPTQASSPPREPRGREAPSTIAPASSMRRSSTETAVLFPEAPTEEDSTPILLLTSRRKGRARRKAFAIVRDAQGNLVDAASGSHEIPGVERRTGSRVSLEVDIGLHSASQLYVGLSNNVSEGGVFVSTVKLLPIGSEVTLSFVLPGGHAVTTAGRVAWWMEPRDASALPGMGVRFERLEPEHRAAIEAFLRMRPPMFHEL